jgi:hypothetical protein
MRNRLLFVGLCLSLLVVTSSIAAGQQSDPRMGTWKVNLSKSKYSPGPPPKSHTLVFEPTSDGGFKMTNDAVPQQGAPTHSVITAKFDGKAYQVVGNPNKIMRIYKRVGARRVESQDTANGKPSYKRSEVVSADGKTLTVTVSGPNAEGVVANNVVIYDKQ